MHSDKVKTENMSGKQKTKDYDSNKVSPSVECYIINVIKFREKISQIINKFAKGKMQQNFQDMNDMFLK